MQYVVSVPPGGSAIAPSGVNIYVQPDWWIDQPDTVYPVPLTSQAIEAAIAGVISFQQTLLASEPPSSSTAVVNIPTNCEALIILASTATGTVPQVQGVTTSIFYPVLNANPGQDSTIFFVAIGSPVDTQVVVTWGGSLTGNWYVISDNGPRFLATVDSSEGYVGFSPNNIGKLVAGLDNSSGLGHPIMRALLTATTGTLFNTPVAPNASKSGDHPVPDIALAYIGQSAVSGATTLLGAPGSGMRYRVYSVACNEAPTASGSSANAAAVVTCGAQLLCPYQYPGMTFSEVFDLPGIPMPLNTAIVLTQFGTTPIGGCTVSYTTEPL